MSETLTTSSLMNFRDCQKFFYFEDALKLQGKQDPFFQFTLELMDLVKSAVASNDSTLVEAKFKEVSPEWFVLAKEMEERVGFLHTAVSRYLKFEFGRQVKNVKTDVLYTVSRVVNGKEYTFSGKVDRIIETEDGYEAIKYKLGYPTLTSAARTPQNLPINCLELAICYAGLREQYPGIRISYYHLRHKDDKSTEPVPVFNDKTNKNIVTAVFNDELCEAALQQLNEIDLDKMKAVKDESEYSKGEGCENCKYHMLESRPFSPLKHVESAIPKPSKAAKLNKKQKEAVERLYGSTRVLAPAGSGKSTVLVMKVVELLKRDVSHKNILLMTFTNKAAEELKERISAATGIAEKELEIYTYNSFCFNVLKRYREFLGLGNITMIKKSDCYNFIREFLEANPIEGVSYSNPYNPNYGIIAELDKTTTTLIDKNLLDTPVEEVMTILRSSKKEYIDYCLHVAKHIRQRMAELGLINYSNQIRLVNKLFTINPNISKVLSYQYQFIMVDEYQDTSSEQSQFIYSIAKHHNNICIVGDDDQTIYSWRKADIKNILLFHEHFPNTKDIIFEENYRSSKAIVNLTDHLIRGNKTRMDKSIVAASAVVGKQPVYTQIEDFSQLLPSIELLLKDYEPMDIAIISRKNGSLEKVDSILNSAAIPVRFQVSYLRDHPSFNKIYNLLQITYEFDTKNDIALYKVLSDLYNYTPAISRNSGTSLYIYLETLEDKYFKDFVEQQLPLIRECSNKEIEEALFTLMNVLEIEETDVVYKWVLDSIKDEEYTTLQQLYNRMKEIDLYNEDIGIEDEGANCVNLITAHGSKGKEYPVVILLDINEFTKDNEGDEETRRILYVALTRAKKELYIFDKATKKQPSPFAAEIQDYLSSTTSAVS